MRGGWGQERPPSHEATPRAWAQGTKSDSEKSWENHLNWTRNPRTWLVHIASPRIRRRGGSSRSENPPPRKQKTGSRTPAADFPFYPLPGGGRSVVTGLGQPGPPGPTLLRWDGRGLAWGRGGSRQGTVREEEL